MHGPRTEQGESILSSCSYFFYLYSHYHLYYRVFQSEYVAKIALQNKHKIRQKGVELSSSQFCSGTKPTSAGYSRLYDEVVVPL